jgi:hypothetical protein
MKKLLVTAGIASMAFLLSSCFVLQGFVLHKGALAPGKGTTLTLTVRPASTDKNPLSKGYQFVLVGIQSSNPDLRSEKATWGTNHAFGGPDVMPSAPAILASIGTNCDGSGFSLSTAMGSGTWKAYTTKFAIPDKQKVDLTAAITVALKALPGATHDDQVTVVAATGAWYDNTGGGTAGAPDATDTYACTGNGSGSIFIK